MGRDLRNILLVEDNPDHVFLARKAIAQEFGKAVQVWHVESGEDAINFLKKVGVYQASPRPDLILLDVQLPGQDGFWASRAIKGDPRFRLIPIVIFTSSDSEKDVREGYLNGANIYVCKPTGSNEFAERLRAIPVFWSRVAHLPPEDGETSGTSGGPVMGETVDNAPPAAG